MNKVLMIGLDGATFYLLDSLMAQGVMPFLSKVISGGVRADLMSTRNPLTPPAWISMVTGRSPSVHTVYDFLKPSTLEDGSVFLRINDAREIRAETVWSMVSRQGKRATSLNFYGTKVRDLSPLQGMTLDKLHFSGTPVAAVTASRSGSAATRLKKKWE